jgi:hypothetical protein
MAPLATDFRRAPSSRTGRLLACWAVALAVGVIASPVPAAAAPEAGSARDGVEWLRENPVGAGARGGESAPERVAPAPEARATSSFLRGFADPHFNSSDAAARETAFAGAQRAGAGIVRINISWRNTTSGVPVSPTNPADPAYDFTGPDLAVRDAAARGLGIIVTVYDAPDFAEGSNQPADSPEGSWKPDPAAFGEFAQAVAARYSGSFTPLGSIEPLPGVRYYEAWNEQNLSEYLSPQFVNGNEEFAPTRYREMLNAFHDGVKDAGGASAEVVFGGTGPYGDPIGQRRTRPLRFMRQVFCLNGRLERTCKAKAKFDVLAHHPISFADGPNYSATHPDDAAMADFDQVVRTLRAAERRGTVTGGRHPTWATEVWWETDPPDKQLGVPLGKHARWVAEGLHSLWKQGADVVIWLQVIDTPIEPDGVGGYQTGLLAADGTEKPGFRAFRFPLVAKEKSKKRARVWLIPPAGGTVEIQEKTKSGFRRVGKMSVRAGKPVQATVRGDSRSQLRAAIGGEVSRTVAVR